MFTIHRCYVPAKIQFFYTFCVLFSEFLAKIRLKIHHSRTRVRAQYRTFTLFAVTSVTLSYSKLIINKIRRKQGGRSFSVTKSTSKRGKTSTHLKKNHVLFWEKRRVVFEKTTCHFLTHNGKQAKSDIDLEFKNR